MNRRVEKTIMIGLFLTRVEVAIAIMRMMNRGRGERNAVVGGRWHEGCRHPPHWVW